MLYKLVIRVVVHVPMHFHVTCVALLGTKKAWIREDRICVLFNIAQLVCTQMQTINIVYFVIKVVAPAVTAHLAILAQNQLTL